MTPEAREVRKILRRFDTNWSVTIDDTTKAILSWANKREAERVRPVVEVYKAFKDQERIDESIAYVVESWVALKKVAKGERK